MAIRNYIEQFNPHAARNVVDSLKAAGNSLTLFPRRGRRVPNTEFREIVTVTPYIICYYVAGSNVVILRVRHAPRRPTTP